MFSYFIINKLLHNVIYNIIYYIAFWFMENNQVIEVQVTQ